MRTPIRRLLSLVALALVSATVSPLHAQNMVITEDEAEIIPIRETGIFFERPDGTFINADIEDDKWVIYFTNEFRQIVPPAYEKVAIRFENLSRSSAKGVVALEKAVGENYLTSPRFVAPPYRYYVTVTLLDPEDSENNIFVGRELLDAVDR